MSAHRFTLVLAAAGCTGLLAAPTAWAAPNYDDRGYVDSTARCAAPDTAVVFGYTESSRVAICESPDGDLTYRGVRVRDGARLITAATRTDDGAFAAERDGIEYLVTSKSLVVSAGEKVIRDEPMLDFHRAGTSTTPAAPETKSTPTSTTPLPPPLPAEVGAKDTGQPTR